MSEHQKVLQCVQFLESLPYEVAKDKSVLIVVDVESYFTRPDCSLGKLFEKVTPGLGASYFSRVDGVVIPNIARLQRTFRAVGLPIIFTAVGSRFQDGRDLPAPMKGADLLSVSFFGHRMYPNVNDKDWQIDERVAPSDQELVINKTSYDTFLTTGLDQTLRSIGAQSVFVAGLLTDVCVSATARACADRGYQTVVVGDASTTVSDVLHESALTTFSFAFGRVLTTDQVAGLFAPATTAVHAG